MECRIVQVSNVRRETTIGSLQEDTTDISKRCMVLGDEKEGMLRKQEKKSKKSNKKAAINGLALTTADVKAIKGDFSFDEEKLAVVETLIQRDKEEMETKAAGEIDQCGVKRKKKRGGNHLHKSNKDSDEDAAEGVEEKKRKLKKSCKDEQQTMQYAPLDTEKRAPASASETWDNDKVVETFGVVSSENAVDEIRRKNKSKKSIKTSATSGEVTNTEVNQGAVFPSIEEREEGSRTENGNIRKRKKVKLGQRLGIVNLSFHDLSISQHGCVKSFVEHLEDIIWKVHHCLVEGLGKIFTI